MKILPFLFLAAALSPLGAGSAMADKMKPFVLASNVAGDLAAQAASVREQLGGNGFEVVGSYSPYADARVLVVTDEGLKQAAAKTKFGVYGAVQRVSLTQRDGKVQVAYTNPGYMAAAYRMDSDLAEVGGRLKAALGAEQPFGCEKECMTKGQLEDYHYTFGMPYFDDPDELASHGSYQEAVAAVEKGLAAGSAGVTKVYRVDIPGKQASVFGVALSGAKSGHKDQDDQFIMGEVDFKELRSTAHLPYEMVVVGNKVYALSAKFRIAINFPDLSMMGDHSFMKIMGAPDAIRDALRLAAGGQSEAGSSWH